MDEHAYKIQQSNTPDPAHTPTPIQTPKIGNTPQATPQTTKKKKGSGGKSRVKPVLNEPIDRSRQSIQYVLTAEERRILFHGTNVEHVKEEPEESEEKEDDEMQDPEEKSALTCILLLMFEELEHQPIVYEKLLTSDLFDGCLKKVPAEQTDLVRKILKNS